MVLHPRHRGNCADFFSTPHQTKRIDFDAPADVIDEIELAAARAGRTWCDQFAYIAQLLMGYHPPDFEDRRTVEDWGTLLSPCKLRLRQTEGWILFTCLWRKAP